MNDWNPAVEPAPVDVSALGCGCLVLRAAMLVLVTYGGLAVLTFVRLFERPLAGQNRPVTPYITQGVCRAGLAIMGIRFRVSGRPMGEAGAVVANHSSWLDIFALNACQRGYFVSKAEVAGWAVIGWLARATGTVFIARDPKAAKAQKVLFEERLRAGHRLMFFPEGTSTDGQRVLPFKSTLFAAFYSHGMAEEMQIQPVSIIYHAPPRRDARFYGWWGDMAFAPHLLRVLAQVRGGEVEVVFHCPVSVGAFGSRKDLASHCESVIRQTLLSGLASGASPAP